MATLEEVIARAETLAQGTGRDPHQSPVLDGTMTAETIFPHAWLYVLRKKIKEQPFIAVSREFNLELIEQKAKLPPNIIFENTCNWSVCNYPYSSFLPFKDFERVRRDNFLCYWSVQNNFIHFSCPVPRILLNFTQPVGMTIDTDYFYNMLGNGLLGLTPEFEKMRVRIVTGANSLVIDSVIKTVLTVDDGNAYGHALQTTTSGTGFIADLSLDKLVRIEPALDTTLNSDIVTGPFANFTFEDVNRRLQIDDGFGNIVLDAYILQVISTTTVRMSAKAMATITGGNGNVMFSPLVLNAPAIPPPPVYSNDEIDASEETVNDIILLIASVLKGEISLVELLARTQAGTA